MELKERALEQTFFDQFKTGGSYAEITNIVKKDNSLIMCFRGDNVCVYYKGLRILKINENGSYELDLNYSKNYNEKLNPNNYIGNWSEYFKDAKEIRKLRHSLYFSGI